MREKILCIGLVAGLAVLTSCGGASGQTGTGTGTAVQETQTTETETETRTQEQTNETETETETETKVMPVPSFEEFASEPSDEARAYYDFLTGKRKARRRNRDEGKDADGGKQDEEWLDIGSLKLRNGYESLVESYDRYAWIDCGNDGKRELVVRYGNYDWIYDSTVLAYIDGEVECIYSYGNYIAMPMYSESLDYYGYGKSSYLLVHASGWYSSSSAYILDKTGEKKEIYHSSNVVDIASYVESHGIDTEVLYDGNGSVNWSLNDVTIGDKSYIQHDSEGKQDERYIKLVQKFEEKGIKFYDSEYLDKLISEREEQLGYTREMKESKKELEWIAAPWIRR